MKKTLCLVIAMILISISLVGCGDAEISSIQEISTLDNVISVTELPIGYGISGFEAYEVIFLSDGLQIQAEIVAPEDYKSKNYPIIYHLLEVDMGAESLISHFAKHGTIVVNIHERGFEKSEGKRDFGGEDVNDVINIASILSGAQLFKSSKAILAGSCTGSILALRAAADSELFDGCAVIDTISDLPAYMESRGEKISELFASGIGKTPEQAQEEYEKRSAIHFAEKINIPTLILAYRDSDIYPIEQATALYNKLKSLGKTCEYIYIDHNSADFENDTAAQALISWIDTVK